MAFEEWRAKFLQDDPLVNCDEDCGALNDPQTPEEIKAAFIHWRSHRNMHGCSHGN